MNDTTKTRRVIFFEPTKFENGDVSVFGDVTFLFQHREAKPSIFSQEFRAVLDARLDSLAFDPVNDYVCVAGSFVMVAIGVAHIASKHESFNALVFHAGTREYVPIKLGR